MGCLQIVSTAIPDVKLIKPQVFSDPRGFFLESYSKRDFDALLGKDIFFVQDNHSRSEKNILRGLHYQTKNTQAKLVRVISGEVFDVAVDMRKNSPSFGQWVGFHLRSDQFEMAWIPEGFAHGFLVLSDYADFFYKTTDYYSPKDECTLKWDDPDLSISWPLNRPPILSAKDQMGKRFIESESFL